MALENLEPKQVFHYFEELTKIPHGTYDQKRISDYCVGFAKELGLECIQDEAYNVIIKKPGTAGYEDSEPVILQGHIDMVCEKTPDSTHDFATDPLDLYIEDGYVRARNTTLGGDDGIAIAYIMTVLASNDLEHPPIEAVFTTDEEQAMDGAIAVDFNNLKGRRLLNLDSEVEGTILAGCEGGYEHSIKLPIEREEKEGTVIEVTMNGFQGGHSGMEIDKQRGNTNKLMGRLLVTLKAEGVDFALVEFNGGSKSNVITAATTAKIVVCPCCAAKAKEIVAAFEAEIRNEFGNDEPNLAFAVAEAEGQTVQAMTKESTQKIVFFVTAAPDGVQCFSRDIKGLVETSLNLGVVITEEASVTGNFRVRSAVKSKKESMKKVLSMWAEFLGGTDEMRSDYPAWEFDPNSKIRATVVDTYKEMFGKEPIVTTIHAALECGIFAGKVDALDSVSFGPTIKDVHSVNERLEIESVQRMWEFLKQLLKNCK